MVVIEQRGRNGYQKDNSTSFDAMRFVYERIMLINALFVHERPNPRLVYQNREEAINIGFQYFLWI